MEVGEPSETSMPPQGKDTAPSGNDRHSARKEAAVAQTESSRTEQQLEARDVHQDSISHSFLAIGDWGYPSDMMKTVAATMAEQAGKTKPHHILALGDNFYNQGVGSVKDPQFRTAWMDVFLCHESLCIPWKVCLGNHDYMQSPQAQVDFTNAPQNPKLPTDPTKGIWQLPSRNYSFSAPLQGGASIEFFALDTNGCQGHVRRQWKGIEEELHKYVAELDEKLKASSAIWKVVFGHHPMHTKSNSHGTLGRCLRDADYTWKDRYGESNTAKGYGLGEVLMRNKVQAYFSGHEHCFQSTFSGGVGHFVCGASGAERARLYGGEDMSERPDHPQWVDRQFHSGFVEASVNATSMMVSFIAHDGHTIYRAKRDIAGDWVPEPSLAAAESS